jgi:hypothetical protein
VLHHVSIEVHPDEVEGCVACWEILGFKRVPAPESIAEYVTWLERQGTQIHIIHSEQPVVPQLGHSAVAVDDFEATFAALEEAGHSPERHQELWGEARGFVVMPGGHRVELMAAPPPPAAS